jgi:hypothetical protein
LAGFILNAALNQIEEFTDGLGVDLFADGDWLRFVATLDPINPDTLSELKRHKGEVKAAFATTVPKSLSNKDLIASRYFSFGY